MTTQLIRWALAAALILAIPAAARGQTFLTPFAGVTTGGDAPTSKFTTGVSLMFVKTVGVEIDFGYTPDFFDEQDAVALIADSNVTNLMVNLAVAPGEGPVRPYGVAGVGLLRTRIDTDDIFDDVSENDFGLSAGAGVIGMFSDNVGVRGDIRYFRRLQDPDGDNDLDIALGTFDYWRLTGGVTFRF
jgi:opacity protein-like surface antigen